MSKLTLEPLIANHLLSITCLESWGDKLLIGTENQGLVIYNIIGSPGGFTAQLESTNKELSYGHPIDQLNIVEQWNSLILLSRGEIIVYGYKFTDRLTFTYQNTLNQKNITKYSLSQSGISPVLCISVPGHFYFYEATGKDLSITSKFDFEHQILDMVLNENKLFIAYHEIGPGGFKSGCFSLYRRTFTKEIYKTHSLPPLIRHCGYNEVLFHQDWVSTVYEDTQPKHKIPWIILPYDISIWNNYCIGIQGDSVEMVPLEGSFASSLVAQIQSLSDTSLQHITTRRNPYVATNNSVWRVIPPYPLPSCRALNYSSLSRTIFPSEPPSSSWHFPSGGKEEPIPDDPLQEVSEEARIRQMSTLTEIHMKAMKHAEKIKNSTRTSNQNSNQSSMKGYSAEYYQHYYPNIYGYTNANSNKNSNANYNQSSNKNSNSNQNNFESLEREVRLQKLAQALQADILEQRREQRRNPVQAQPSTRHDSGHTAVAVTLPDDFSPDSPLSVVGLSHADLTYFDNSINTVEKLSNRPKDFMKGFYGNVYYNAYLKAVEFMTIYKNWMKEIGCSEDPEFTSMGDGTEVISGRPVSEKPVVSEKYGPDVREEPLSSRWGYSHPTFDNVNPEDPLEAIGISEPLIEFLATIDVFTVRQFACMNEVELSGYGDELVARHSIAVECMKAHPEKSQKQVYAKPTDVTHYGYVYLTATEFAKVIEEGSIKSAYVLFQEYVDCPPEARDNHAWKDVYFRHLRAATTHFGSNPQTEIVLSDADVFSYLCWEYTSSFAKLDITAGARAIFFYWSRINQTCFEKLMLDKNKDEPIRFGSLVRINLTLLCHNYSGKMLNREESSGEGVQWSSVELERCDSARAKHDKINISYDHFTSPTGCIVLPSGIVPSDCLSSYRVEYS